MPLSLTFGRLNPALGSHLLLSREFRRTGALVEKLLFPFTPGLSNIRTFAQSLWLMVNLLLL